MSTVEPRGGQAGGGTVGKAASAQQVSRAPGAPAPTPAAAAPATPVKPEPAYGAWVVIAGLAAIVVVFGIAVLRYSTAAEVTTAVGAVSGVIAALVGAYFGS